MPHTFQHQELSAVKTKRQLERGEPSIKKCRDRKICEPGECRFAEHGQKMRKNIKYIAL